MSIKVSGKPLNITCTEHAFPEFPDLLYGRQSDDGIMYFDASAYIQSKKLTVGVADFLTKCEWQIERLLTSYGVPLDKCFVTNSEGHILIDGTFTYLFLSFVEQNFMAFMCDRIHEIFTEGFAVSDSYILNKGVERLNFKVGSTEKIESNEESK